MTNQEKCMAGICCDCGAPMSTWTEGEIEVLKNDLGMAFEEDFAACCLECDEKYTPE